MRKIMFMTNCLYGGGAEKILQIIISNLNYEKYDVTLYSLHKESVEDNLYRGGFTYKSVFGNGSWLFEKIKGWIFNNCPTRLFYLLFIRGKYDVEVAFIEGESTKIVAGSTNRKSKKVAWVHTDLEKNPWTSFLYNDVSDESAHYNNFDDILCVSNDVKAAFVRKYQVEKKISTLYNPVDRERIVYLSQEKCKLHPKKHIRMIAVGRLVVQKGFDRLLRIAKRLKEEYNFEIIILGEGKEREKLQRFIVENDLSENIFLAGFQENPYCCMAASDLLVCSSRTEGFSTVVTEGVVLGLPVVSTDCAGVREIFGDMKCGIITENDEDALYEALKKVISNPDCLKEYHEAAIVRGRQFSLELSMKRIDELLSE